MESLGQLVLLLVVFTDFAVLGSSRLSACIRAMAVQGLLLGLLPPILYGSASVHTIVFAIGTILVKATLLPAFLRWAIREASVRREVEPLIGYMASLLLGLAALAASFAVANVLPTVIVLITRAKALTQVLGYLMLENGIYVFGLTQLKRVPFLVEVGVLLDVFVGVFIMGIVVFHINREFDSISAARLTELRE